MTLAGMNSVKSNRLNFTVRGGQFGLVALICCLLATSGCRDGGGKVNADRFSALGNVMGEKTAALCHGQGSVVLLVSENDYNQATPYGLAFAAFSKALGNTVPVIDLDVVETPKALGPGSEPLSASKFVGLLQKHARAEYLVSFIRVPALTQEQIAQLPSPRPQVVGVIPNPQLTKLLFTSKVLCLAVVAKPGAQDVADGSSAQEQFDSHYQLIKPDTTELLSR